MRLFESWNTVTITALSAICGSLVGALGSSLSAWIAQRHHDREDLLAKKTAQREQWYSHFIRESGQALSSPQGLNAVARMPADGTITARIRATVELDGGEQMLDKLITATSAAKGIIHL
jgi:hypothetical protein